VSLTTKKEYSLDWLTKKWHELTQSVKLEELLIFNRQFQTIYAMGVPLIKGLSLIEDQVENPYFKLVLQKIIADVNNGDALEIAFARHPKVFDSTYVNLLKAGEASGKLEQILERLSLLSEQRAENRERIRSALLYPKMVLVVLSIAFLTIVYFVLPKLKDFYSKFNAQLPPITRGMMAFSDFMVHTWYIALAIVCVAAYLARRYLSSPEGRRAWHRVQLKLPIFGILIRQIETNSFCGVLELLVAGGVPIIEALTLTRESLTNEVFKTEVERFKNEVEQGGSIAKGLSASPVFPRMVGNLIAVGEEVGALESALARISQYYRLQISHKIANLSKTLEPLLLVVIFGAVLLLALGIFLPIWKMSSLIRKTGM
jgi:type II secretory pathway component PulF